MMTGVGPKGVYLKLSVSLNFVVLVLGQKPGANTRSANELILKNKENTVWKWEIHSYSLFTLQRNI